MGKYFDACTKDKADYIKTEKFEEMTNLIAMMKMEAMKNKELTEKQIGALAIQIEDMKMDAKKNEIKMQEMTEEMEFRAFKILGNLGFHNLNIL